PKNKTAYFLRATAYFELGNFDEVLEDYLKSNRCGELEYPRVEVSNDFTEALLRSTVNGAKEAAVEFVPSLCNSVYGLGDVLWATAQHPVESIQDFSSACYEMGESAAEFCKNFDWDTIEECVDKARVLCENYHQLSDTEKGELFGYTIGKYGIGIFAGTTLFKGV
ncbi:MAG: tetratricopeptide repeat protein, partial [Parachlamydiaceae bacterium]|nr:tetratricopeptide repeat protein [Parachlamydiaceae bacterium]